MSKTVIKYDHDIKMALSRLADLKDNVWLGKVDPDTIISELTTVLNILTVSNDLRNKEVEEMKWKLKDLTHNSKGRR